MLYRRFFGLVCGLMAPGLVLAHDIINLHYHERPPYFTQLLSKDVHGVVATPAKRAFDKAQIDFKWQETPPKRQLQLIRYNSGKDCLVGWFKNAERARFGKFTLPIYQDDPTIALARADNPAIRPKRTLKKLLTTSDLTVLRKDGYSYGQYIDKHLTLYHPDSLTTAGNNASILKMLYKRRGDYFFVAREEADFLIARMGYPRNAFKQITFSDMPAGEKRYILCSKQVDDQIIERLNQAIASLYPRLTP